MSRFLICWLRRQGLFWGTALPYVSKKTARAASLSKTCLRYTLFFAVSLVQSGTPIEIVYNRGVQTYSFKELHRANTVPI